VGKKIISYSCWGRNKMYLCGLLENIKLAKVLFPGWIVRAYCASDLSPNILKDAKDLGCEIVLKKPTLGFQGLFWRLEVADDPEVDRFIVRDTDSRLTKRDALCVEEWINSDLPFHIIRDCESHGAWILGATFGMCNKFLVDHNITMKELIYDFWEDYYNSDRNDFQSDRGLGYGLDQEMLSRKIWNLIDTCHLAHDEHFHFTGKERPFPYKREYLPDMSKAKEPYIGQVVNLEPKWSNYEL